MPPAVRAMSMVLKLYLDRPQQLTEIVLTDSVPVDLNINIGDLKVRLLQKRGLFERVQRFFDRAHEITFTVQESGIVRKVRGNTKIKNIQADRVIVEVHRVG